MAETIAAIATPPGLGGVGIVRISGQETESIAKQLLGALPKPRYAWYTNFLDQEKQPVDKGIALYFPAPHSFTGESVLELQAHGGPVVLDCLLKEVLACGARLAEPGEFTLRAFLNGRMDLLQAEAVAGMITAGSEQAMRSASRSLQGAFSKSVDELVSQLVSLRVFVEAAIDFTDEDIDFLSEGQVTQRLEEQLSTVTALLRQAQQGALLQQGATLAIVGQPNVGKSSLLNCLTGRASAIVTAHAGTTRDVLREQIQIDGLPIHLVDTAGIRETEDVVEKEGVARAWQAVREADCLLYVADLTNTHKLSTDPMWTRVNASVGETVPIITVGNKIDLCAEPAEGYERLISAKTGEGVDCLRDAIKSLLGYQLTSETPFLARRRHLDALQRAKTDLDAALSMTIHSGALELIAESLRLAAEALSTLTGKMTADDLLGEIFSTFCVGK